MIDRARRGLSPLGRGFVWALGSALAFGATTPLVARFGAHLGPWTIAALLYVGAAAFALPLARDVAATLRVRRRTWLLFGQGVVGAMLAPAALAAGLHRAGPLGASLALTMEVPLSVALAALVFREFVTRRVVVACAAISLGALALGLPTSQGGGAQATLGIAFVVVATALWAVDNALASLLVDVAFGTTIVVKAALGATFSTFVALAVREPQVAFSDGLGLAVVGAIGYGASLWFYLRAQRTFGIARTASVFALAPFVGAALALALGARGGGIATFAGFLAILVGAYLHATERHAHPHVHPQATHVHAHRHDDGHHAHAHDEPVRGEHVHEHDHDRLAHAHAHAPDADHAHEHA